MAKYYTNPDTGERYKIQKTHKFRNFVVLPGLALVGIGIAVGAVNSGNSPQTPPAEVSAAAPAGNTGPAAESRLEVFGTEGQAMVSVMTDGVSTNTESVPHSKALPEGYASVTVTISPSVEDYANGGTPDAAEVGCRIVRAGQVVDERTATGQFASVTCSKMY